MNLDDLKKAIGKLSAADRAALLAYLSGLGGGAHTNDSGDGSPPPPPPENPTRPK